MSDPALRKGSYRVPDQMRPPSAASSRTPSSNGHPARPDHGPGPMEAVEAFLPGHPEFRVDRNRERFLMSMNPSGFLLRSA